MAASDQCSMWRATAAEPSAFPALTGDRVAEIVIVGGGFTGLTAARYLTAAGIDCVVIEAHNIGWGASGRTGGFVVPRFKKGFAALARQYGTAEAQRLHAMVHEAVDSLEQTVEELAIDCGFTRCGHLTAAHSQTALAALADDVEWLASAAGDRTPRLLDADTVQQEIGGGRYVGGYLDPRGGAIHPLAYARGLAAALADRGVPIFVDSPATRIDNNDDAVIVKTSSGTVRARQAIIATNAHTTPGLGAGDLHRRVVPVASSIVATAPLSKNLAATVMPAGRPVSDTRHLMHYFRKTPDDRILFGGRGDITGRRDDPAVTRHLEDALAQMFPQIGDVEIAHRWSGFVAVTRDAFPHIGRLSDRVLFALGYGGRGVALTNLMGKYLARMAAGETVDAGPMSKARFKAYPFHDLRVPAMRLASSYYRVRDAWAR